jgi:hypothetical protein
MRKLAAILLLSLPAAASAAADDPGRLPAPRMTVALAAGRGMFRGGTPPALLASALPFQPDVDAGTLAGTLSVRLARALALELEVAHSRGPVEDGRETPDNVFFTAGLRVPFSAAGGKLVPYLTAGGGVAERQPQDGFERTLERVLDVKQTDPVAYAGAGLDLRLHRRFGLRADYRYLRLFPGDLEGLALARPAYGVHRATGGLVLAF